MTEARGLLDRAKTDSRGLIVEEKDRYDTLMRSVDKLDANAPVVNSRASQILAIQSADRRSTLTSDSG